MELTAEQEQIKRLTREFTTDQIQPIARDADATQEFPTDVWQGLCEIDLTAMTVPEEYGGLDVDRVTYSVINEELAYGSLAIATALGVHCLATSCIAEFGTPLQKDKWLPSMATGNPIGAFALSEPSAGSNPRQMTTVATRDGDSYVITGEKQWITNGERSDVVIVFAKTDPDDPDSITQFLVPKDRTGLVVGEKEDKLGLRGSDTTPLIFEDVRIPVANRLTDEGEGLKAALSILTGGRIGIASQSVGLAQAALDDAVAYADERVQFGRTISAIQTIRHKLAEMATNVHGARLMARDAATRDDDGKPVRMHASMAKYFASTVAMSVTNEALQIHGGYGYVRAFDVERYYRDAKVTTIYEGTSEIQKEVIARELIDSFDSSGAP